jgi:methylenetetrahydrofolate reductase (NADPH)
MQDEAFSLWQDWASHYPPDSASRAILDSVIQKRWLVSIVHHDYRDPSALWTFLKFEE